MTISASRISTPVVIVVLESTLIHLSGVSTIASYLIIYWVNVTLLVGIIVPKNWAQWRTDSDYTVMILIFAYQNV